MYSTALHLCAPAKSYMFYPKKVRVAWLHQSTCSTDNVLRGAEHTANTWHQIRWGKTPEEVLLCRRTCLASSSCMSFPLQIYPGSSWYHATNIMHDIREPFVEINPGPRHSNKAHGGTERLGTRVRDVRRVHQWNKSQGHVCVLQHIGKNAEINK